MIPWKRKSNGGTYKLISFQSAQDLREVKQVEVKSYPMSSMPPGTWTLMYRQSSLSGDSPIIWWIGAIVWIQALPQFEASLTDDHGSGILGSAKRKSPIGCCAKGMPRYTSYLLPVSTNKSNLKFWWLVASHLSDYFCLFVPIFMGRWWGLKNDILSVSVAWVVSKVMGGDDTGTFTNGYLFEPFLFNLNLQEHVWFYWWVFHVGKSNGILYEIYWTWYCTCNYVY